MSNNNEYICEGCGQKIPLSWNIGKVRPPRLCKECYRTRVSQPQFQEITPWTKDEFGNRWRQIRGGAS